MDVDSATTYVHCSEAEVHCNSSLNIYGFTFVVYFVRSHLAHDRRRILRPIT